MKEEYEPLATAYDKAICICDPIEYAKRQQVLLYELARFLLKPYKQILRKETEKMAEGRVE